MDHSGNYDMIALAEAFSYLSGLEVKPDVVNMSFGAPASGWSAFLVGIEYGLLCEGAINELSEDYGIVFVAASGNEGENGNAIEYPAALNHVIGVGSVDEQSHNRLSFSTANSTVDLCAVGNRVLSTTDTSSGFADGKNYYADRYTATYGNGAIFICGTSFSAPQVSAAAALVKHVHPNWSSLQVEEALESTATDLGDSGCDDIYGYGLLNAAVALSSGGSSDEDQGSPNTGGSARGLLLGKE